MARPWSELRDKMSPEAQARSKAEAERLAVANPLTDDIPALVAWLGNRAKVYDDEAVNDPAAFDFWRGHGNCARGAAAALSRLSEDLAAYRAACDRIRREYGWKRDGREIDDLVLGALAERDAELAEAREVCPAVRMQDHADATLLTLVNLEVSRGFNSDAEIRRLVARLITAERERDRALAALARYENNDRRIRRERP